MRNTRDVAFRFALDDEGASFKPRGTKGELERKFGIDLRQLAMWRGDATPSQLKELAKEEALQIYEAELWNPCRADLLPTGLDYFCFDTSLVCGVENTNRWLRLVSGGSGFDVQIDDGIISLVSQIEPEIAISGVEFFRRRRFKSDPRWRVLGPEWTNRCNRAKRRALKMIHGEL
jgi:lysozyme family protein